ncbi:Metal tolerance protein 1 [Turnera subulata]|uniref:Metal tolerance protein 1 n=1 Tax=Turnera subulata TaxID=218843 RepID=A0A9Q0JRL6_9ROSI|nr:Metal tolerance protein 1 [Turnera subulata]
MEVPNSDHGHMIEIHGESSDANRGISGSKICGGAACGFSDANTSSKDAKERSQSMRKLWIAVVLCVIFMSVEVAGGIKANSLAILTDAAHLLSDIAAFAISLCSLWAAGWEATPRQSYGYFRIEILGALISVQMIWLLAGILVYEAIARLIHDTGDVQGFLMFIVSAFGLVVNIVMALLLGHEHGHRHGHGHGVHSRGHDDGMHKHSTYDIDITEPLLESGSEVENRAKEKKSRNINVQGAYLHALGDSIQSVGVMVGGAIIWYKPELKIVDLICTLVFSVIVLGTTIRMLRSVLEVLMESTPREIDATELEKGLSEMDEVVAIHELHIWAITVGKILLASHVMIKPDIADADMVLEKVRLQVMVVFVGQCRIPQNEVQVVTAVDQRPETPTSLP